MVAASLATSMSGSGVRQAITAPSNSGPNPHQRQPRRQSASHNPPKLIISSAESGMAGAKDTAPGSPETQRPIATITPIPCPSHCRANPSSPNGISATDSAAAGITQNSITGMAIRLPSTA